MSGSNRPVLILGAAGFIGRHLVFRFASAGHPVIAAVRRQTSFEIPNVRVEVAPFDQRADFLPLLSSAPLVIHAASSTTPGASAAQPQIEGNLRTTLALIEALQESPGARLIYLSSGGTLYGARDTPAVESDPIVPRSYHGAGKAAAEHFIHAWAEQYGGSAIILRPSNVYGPGQLPKAGFGVIPTAFEAVLEDRNFTIWGDGSAERDFLYVRDLVDLIESTLTLRQSAGTLVLNAGSGMGTRLDALIAEIERTCGTRIRVQYKPARTVDIKRIALDCRRASDALGWTPTIGLETGLAATWAWIQSAAVSGAAR